MAMFNQGSQMTGSSQRPAKRLHFRAYIYMALIFGLVCFTTCEMKTGISLVGGPRHLEGPVRIHESWTWKQVALEFPDEMAWRLLLVMLFVIPFEFGFQCGRSEKKEDGTN